MYNRLIANLSKGYKQRVGIAQALIGNPPVLILDEPTVGLDPKQIIEIRNLIKSLGRNHTVILSSHILPEVQAVCERVIVINRGKLVADGNTDTLAHNLSTDFRLIARIDGPEKEVEHALIAMENVKEALCYGEKEKGVFEFSIETDEDHDVRRNLFALLARKGWPLLSLRNTDLTLEEVFLRLTSGDAESYIGSNRRERRERIMLAIAKRDLKSSFSSPIGYVCVALILAFFGYFYFQVLMSGSNFVHFFCVRRDVHLVHDGNPDHHHARHE